MPLQDELTYMVIGCAMEVHKLLFSMKEKLSNLFSIRGIMLGQDGQILLLKVN
jgi:hypothetical protein